MRLNVLTLVVSGLLAPFVVMAAELDPLAVTVDVPPADPATAEAMRKCRMARAEQEAKDNAKTQEQLGAEALARLMKCTDKHEANETPCDRWSLPDPSCKAADAYAAVVNAARAKASQARDDCIKADPVAFAGYVNLRNHALVTTEQMTAVRRCVEQASQARR